MRLALYEPEIPQNTGTLLRLGACMGVPIDIIEPCGFIWNDQKLRRAGMDYLDLAHMIRHASWEHFWKHYEHQRIILLDAQGETNFFDFTYQENDILLVGKESCGVPSPIFNQVSHRVSIPIAKGCRSLNMAIAGSMVLTEALRQTSYIYPS